MRLFFTVAFFTISGILFSQQIDYNTKKGYLAIGYDVVSYFVDNKPVKGNKKFQAIHDGVKFKFSSEKNLALFKANPGKYIPQYGGYCAYAMGAKATKVSIDPETYEIRDNKLYLFYNSWGRNTLKIWTKTGPEKLKEQADKNWAEINK
ncbi:MAG: YHS domain-containing protein [Flavobacteriaceae bacterium]|nr:MAG: YHS domain-containing protein [Flavobacteriaceae bacterium]